MSDVHSPEIRSKNMAAIRSSNTKPEIYLRKLLFSKGYRYRKNDKRIFGKPDIYLPRYRTVIFVHGCFWHRHKNCKYASVPKTRQDFWQAKFQRNVERDREVICKLQDSDLRILVVWECTIKEMMKSEEKQETVLKDIESFIHSKDKFEEL